MSFAAFDCLCFLFLLFPLIIVAQKHDTMTLGSYLIAGDDSPILSPSGDFAFGFQQVGTGGGFLVAIWFNKIPEKTVTWSANRDALVPRGSKLQLTLGSRLVITDAGGSEMQLIANGTSATLDDSGNLVLVDDHSTPLWQSFDVLTDTLLPTQVMKEDVSLIARTSDSNYSSGRFLFFLQLDGNLVFYTLHSPGAYYLPAYDATGTFGADFQVVFNQSGSIYVAAKDGSTQAVVLEDHTDHTLYYQRAILEFDGVFRKYVYPRSSSTGFPMKWTMKGLRPRGICSRVTSGTGVCGANSICKIGDDQLQRPTCACPPQYRFLDQMDHMKGCKPDFTQQSCFEDPTANSEFQLVEILNTNFPDSSYYETLTGTSEVPCHDSCLSDCYCAAVVFQDITCKKTRFPISNGWVNQSGPSIPSKAFIKLRIGNSTSTEPVQHSTTIQQKETDHRAVILIESVFLGSSVCINILLLILAVFTVSYCTNKRKGKTRDEHDIAGTNMRSFSYKELEEATDGFKVVVGQGAFATVYRGVLDSENGNVIAVKKLNEAVKENQREFESEVKAIARTGHRNLVQLIGVCNEEQHRLLVYEYMPNGSLADILLQVQRPNLSTRMKFALEAARGLNYLHEECSIQIIHCDIKLQNILLDDSFAARISDFGIAKLLKKDQAHTMTGIRGTKGYVAPEWFKSVPVTTKVDVYSYGILLLELICCRRCFEAEMEDENQMVLADWAYDCYQEGRVDKLVEDDDEALAEIERIKKFVMIALWCIQEDPSLRPSMNNVVQMMKEALEETLPQDLALCISPMSIGYVLKTSDEIHKILNEERHTADLTLDLISCTNSMNVVCSSSSCISVHVSLWVSAEEDLCIAKTFVTNAATLQSDSSSSWVSPSGDFAFGFQQLGATDNFILAIWFNNIPDKTFTWSAGSIAQRGSKLQLTLDGRLVLSDSGGTEIWSPIGGGAAYASMLNTGNFVVTGKGLVVLWQSFDHPTDTILPTQTLNPGTSLMAHYSESNYSISGRFNLSMQQDGSFVFHKIDGLQDLKYLLVYEETSAAGSGNQVVFDQSGLIYVRAKNGTKIVVLPDSGTTDDLYQRAILEFDGVFRRYTYPRSNATNRPMAWSMQSFVPQDICRQIQGSTSTGGGACGFNSYCQIGVDQMPKCSCPPGYSFSDPTDQMNGCKVESVLESCEEGTRGSSQFQLKELASGDFPGSDTKSFTGVSETSCRNLCLSDCSCAAAVFEDGTCWKKASPLLNGVVDPAFRGKALIKVSVDNSLGNHPPSGNHPPADLPIGGHHKKDHSTAIIIESVFLGTSVFLNILLLSLAVFTASFCAYKRIKAEPKGSQDIPGTNIRSFTYKELEEATNGFKEVVGRGAFATVYKGVLESEEGSVIAVKKLNELVKENQSEFESEVRAIARTGHRNLVQLIGFCNEQQHRLLVYEYMSNGALAGVLFQRQRPNWSRRMKFALETARGLNYLHEECSIQIIHCDIKPQNVLLDDSFTTRISDFGLAKLLNIDETHTMTGIRGTKGYVAPEWFRSMPITTKADVYSYGILLLELVCCRRCFEVNMEDESQKVLADWAYDCYKEGRADKLVEGNNGAMNDMEGVKKFVLIALWCIQEDPSLRPSMKKVVQMIQGPIEEPLPSDLASDINSMNGV